MLLYKTLSRFSFQIFVWTFDVYTFVSPPSSSARSTQSMPKVRKNKNELIGVPIYFFPSGCSCCYFILFLFIHPLPEKIKKIILFFGGNNWYYRNQIS
jgi:hypothetical protein